MSQPIEALSDVLIVEVDSGIAGAYCAQILRQLGARVVKAGPEEPGTTRDRAERLYVDSGKEIVDSDVVVEMLPRADVVVWGAPYTAGDAHSLLRARYDDLRRVNPDVVFVAPTPFGSTAAFERWRGRSLQAQAVTGWPAFVGEPDEAPLSSNYGGGELQHGLFAACAALTAILNRPNVGGDFVDVSLADTMGSGIRVYSHVYRLYGLPLRRAGLRAPGSSGRYPHRVFRCKDGVVSVICRMTAEWERFVRMIGSPAWANDPRYQDFYAMATQYPDEVDALINPWMLARTKAELAALAIEYRVPMAPVRTVPEALQDEQMSYRGFFRTVDGEGVTATVPGLPTQWTST